MLLSALHHDRTNKYDGNSLAQAKASTTKNPDNSLTQNALVSVCVLLVCYEIIGIDDGTIWAMFYFCDMDCDSVFVRSDLLSSVSCKIT